MTKAICLEILDRGATFGSDIKERILDLTSGKIRIGDGSLYPALEYLHKQKFVKIKSIIRNNRGGRPTIIYQLTSKGRKRAKENRSIVLSLYR